MVIDHQLNPEKYTKEQLKDNAAAAAPAAAPAATAAYATATAAPATESANYWLDQYFKRTGENKQDYIDAINKDNKQ
jgi:hypothetical protein